jgi:O-antigen/teichoic acid export membrane protein
MELKKLFFKAYLWNTLSKFVIRGLGVISTLILVRILGPADFGVIAIANMVTGFFIVISTTANYRYLIIHRNIPEEQFSSFWTLNLCFKLISIFFLFLSAPLVADFMQDERLVLVIRLLSGIELIAVFRNIGMVTFQREINYAPENKILMVAKVVSTIFTISFTVILENYFALIIGTFINILISTIGTYVVSSFRPKLDFKFEWKMFSFSGFIMARNIIGYSRSQIDTLFVGRLFGSSAVGNYKVAMQFGIMPQTEILGPAMQPAFSALSSLKDNVTELHNKAYQSLFLSYLIVVPAAFGLHLVGPSFVMTVLGEQWIDAIPLIQVLGFLMIPFATQPILNNLYDAQGKTKFSLFTDAYGISVIVIITLLLKPNTASIFSDFRVLIGFSSVLLGFLLSKIFLRLHIWKLLVTIVVPIIISLIMYSTVANAELNYPNSAITLIANALTGVFVYFVVSVLLINILGRFFGRSFLYRLFPKVLINYVSMAKLE